MENQESIYQQSFKKYLADIRFWLILFFLIRLFSITSPPLETTHNWRQTFTCMITRNLVEQGPDLLHPQIDMAGEKTGIIGSEFPFFNYLNYCVSQIFGFDHWHGRLINLIFSSLGIWFFYRIVSLFFAKRVAFLSSFLLLISLWFIYSRKIMPDTFSISLILIGGYYGIQYLRGKTSWYLLLYFLLISLGLLSKIPGLSLLAACSIVPFLSQITISRRLLFTAVTGIAIALSLIWFFYWAPYLVSTYHYQLFFPKGIIEGIKEIIPFTSQYFEQFYFHSFKSYLAIIPLLSGVFFLFFSNENRNKKMSLAFITLFFLIFTIKTGAVFPQHDYYIIPFVPVMAIFAGYGLSRLKPSWSYLALGVICIEAIANQQHDFFIKEDQRYKLTLEESISDLIPQKELVIINGGASPTDIYFSHRKGWSMTTEQLLKGNTIDSLVNQGAKYLILDLKKAPFVPQQGEAILTNEHYHVFRLSAQ